MFTFIRDFSVTEVLAALRATVIVPDRPATLRTGCLHLPIVNDAGASEYVVIAKPPATQPAPGAAPLYLSYDYPTSTYIFLS